MLAWIFIISTAKPISVRRLLALFVCVLVVTWLALGVLGFGQPKNGALIVAAAATAVAWLVPLLRFVVQTIRRGNVAWYALDSVSSSVQFSYALALAALPLGAAVFLLSSTRDLALSAFLRLGTLTILMAIAAVPLARLSVRRKKRVWFVRHRSVTRAR